MADFKKNGPLVQPGRPESPAMPRAAVDWTKPIGVVVDGQGTVDADVLKVDDDVVLVCWGNGRTGQRSRVGIFRPDGSGFPLRVENVEPPAFDPLAFFRTRDGRPAVLLAVVDPSIGETAVIARVKTPAGVEAIMHYRADGTHAFGAGRGCDDLVNVDGPAPAAPSPAEVLGDVMPFDYQRPAMTRDGSAVRNVRVAMDGLLCEVFVRSQGVWVDQSRRDDGRVGGTGEHPADLVNVDAP